MKEVEMMETNTLANLHRRFREIKKSKVISLVLVLFLVLALTLIPSGNVSALGAGDFFLTDEELPSGWERDTRIFKTWPGPHMGIRTKLMGGYWSGKMYSCRDGGGVTVCVGYYPTEEEAKKLMYPDVYIYETDIYAATGHQGTTLSEWAQQSTEYQDCSFSSGTAYGDEGFTAQRISCTIYGGSKTVTGVYRVNIFRIRNVIFQVIPTASLHNYPKSEGVIEPLVAEKARRLLGEPVTIKDECPKQPSLSGDGDDDGVPDWRDLCPKQKQGTVRKGYDPSSLIGCPDNPTKWARLKVEGERAARKQLKAFIGNSCADVPDAVAHEDLRPGSAIVDKLKFKYTSKIEYKPKSFWDPKSGMLDMGHPSAWAEFFLAERKLWCTGKMKKATLTHDNFYHEVGHYLTDALGYEYGGAGGEHDAWAPCTTYAQCFDEATADLSMLLMSRHLKRPSNEEGVFSAKTVQAKLKGIPPGTGAIFSELQTAFFLDILPKDPCKAMKVFNLARAEMKSVWGMGPQGIDAWLIGYMMYIDGTMKGPQKALHETYLKQRLNHYRIPINSEISFVDNLSNPVGVMKFQYLRGKGWLKKKLTLKGSVPNKVRTSGSGMDVWIIIDSARYSGRVFSIRHKQTDYETELHKDGSITVTVHEGSVELSPPDLAPLTIYAGQSYTWNPNTGLGTIGHSVVGSGGGPVVGPGGNVTNVGSGGASLESVADAYVYAYTYRNWNKANWGKYGSLGAGWHPAGGEKRTYLKFDLSRIDPKNLGKATLKLFHYHTGGGNNRLSLGVYAITQSWQEGNGTYHSGRKEKTAAAGEISWVNQPSSNLDPIAQFNPGPGTNKFDEVDITPLVMAWLTGKPNYGLMIKPVGIMSGRAPESSYGFYSREHQDKSKRPVLILSGSSISDTPTGSKRPLGDITRITDYPQAAENIRGAPCGIDRTFVFSLFQCILERDPEKKELAEQVQNLQSGMSRKEIVIRFFKSREYLNKMKSGRESYKDAFQTVLGRNPSSEEIRAFPRTWPFMMAMKLFDTEEYRNLCPSDAGGIRIESATYGGNCGATWGNVTSHIARQCNGKSKCRYTVNHKIIGDPAPGCAKTYAVRYRCGNNPQVFEMSLPAEAGWEDKTVLLECSGSQDKSQTKTSTGKEISASFTIPPRSGSYAWEYTKLLTIPGNGAVVFDAKATNDIHVCFAETASDRSPLYEVVIGGWNNTQTVIRKGRQTPHNGHARVNAKQNPQAMVAANRWATYWVSVNCGLVAIGRGKSVGQNIILTWQDPDPLQNLKTIAFSTWNTPVEYRNIRLRPVD